MSIANFWTQPIREQELLRLNEKLAELDREIASSNLIRYKGKLIKAEDYPCKCDLQCPHLCWEDKHPNREYKGQQCKCRCHSVYEPF